MAKVVVIRALITMAETFVAVTVSAGLLLDWDLAVLIAAIGSAAAAGLEVIREWLGHIKKKYDRKYEVLYEETQNVGDE